MLLYQNHSLIIDFLINKFIVDILALICITKLKYPKLQQYKNANFFYKL
jgi:hypothetical protein